MTQIATVERILDADHAEISVPRKSACGHDCEECAGCGVCLLDGIFVPFFMEEYRFRSDSTALVKLEGVDTAERARMFTNVEVYFPVKHAEEAGEGELSWEFFVGFRMEDVHHGMLGEVVDVDTATVNTLFIVEREGEELLVPAQEEFIRGIDQQQKLITVELPEGLLNLDELEEEE